MKCPICGKENPQTYWVNETEFKQKWCLHAFSDWIKEIDRLKKVVSDWINEQYEYELADYGSLIKDMGMENETD